VLNRSITLTNGGGLFDVPTGATFSLNGGIGGAGVLTKFDLGTLVLAGANIYLGGTNIAGGVVAVTSDSNLGPGPLAIEDSNLEILSAGGGMTSNKPITLLDSGGGIVADSGTTSTLSGVISGPGALRKEGPGTLFVTGANTYAGGTLFNGGILAVKSDTELGTGPLTFDGGTLEALATGGGITSNKPIAILGSGGRFLADPGTNSILSGSIAGASNTNNSFTKDGSGTLILSGVNTYAGSTSVVLGTLKAGASTAFSPLSDFVVDSVLDLNGFDNTVGSLAGTGLVTNTGLTAASLTAGVANNANTTFNGTLADGRSRLGFIKAGGGTMILTGPQTYSGNTMIVGGTLQLGDDRAASSIVGSVVTSTGGTLVLYNADSSRITTIANANNGATVFDNASSAGHSLITSVSGGITLFFNQSTAGHAALITNSGGETQFAGTSTAGNSTITTNTGGLTSFTAASTAASATIVTNAGGSTLFTGSSTGGQARLITNAGGIVDISKVTSSNGMTAGSVEGAGTYFLGANTLTVGLNNRSTEVSGVIADGKAHVGGSLIKTGAGTLTLSGLNTYSGGTVIDDGTLTIDGTQALGLGNVVVNGGILNADPQPINVKGNYLQSAGGTLQLQVAGANAGQYDFLNVGGSATLRGTLQLISLGFKPAAGNTLTLVTSKGMVSGQFARLIDPFTAGPGFSTVLLLYSAHHVNLEFLKASVPPGVPSVPTVPTGPAAPGTVPVKVIPISIAEFDPGNITAVYTIGFADATLQLLNLEDILEGVRAGCSGFSSNMKINGGAAAPGGKEVTEDGESAAGGALEPVFRSGCDNRWGVWVIGFGDFVTVDGDASGRGYNFITGGVTLGLDYRVTDHLVIGAMGDYSHTWTALQPAGHLDADTGEGGFYATWYDHGIYLNTGIFAGHNTNETSRANIGGMSTGSTEGAQWSSFLGAGYDFHAGDLTIGPVASLQYTSLTLGGFTEKGSLAPFDIHSGSAESLRSEVGLRAFYQWQIGKILLRPSVKAAWEHEYKYSAFPITAGFAGLPETAQTFDGPKLGQDSAVVSAGVSAQWSPAFSVYVHYDGQLGRSHYDSNAVTGGCSIGF
jgi:autotransporter-associated beta strand protein